MPHSTHERRGRVPGNPPELGHGVFLLTHRLAHRPTYRLLPYRPRRPLPCDRANELSTPPFPRTVPCGSMQATPTGTALTGDTPSAALRRPGTGTGTHHHPPHPLGRHRHGSRRCRGPLFGPAARFRARSPGRRPADEVRARRLGPRDHRSRLPPRLRPREGRRTEEGIRGPRRRWAAGDGRRGPLRRGHGHPARRRLRPHPGRRSRQAARRRHPGRPEGPRDGHRLLRTRRRGARDTARLLDGGRAQLLPRREGNRQVAVAERHVRPLHPGNAQNV